MRPVVALGMIVAAAAAGLLGSYAAHGWAAPDDQLPPLTVAIDRDHTRGQITSLRYSLDVLERRLRVLEDSRPERVPAPTTDSADTNADDDLRSDLRLLEQTVDALAARLEQHAADDHGVPNEPIGEKNLGRLTEIGVSLDDGVASKASFAALAHRPAGHVLAELGQPDSQGTVDGTTTWMYLFDKTSERVRVLTYRVVDYRVVEAKVETVGL